MNLAELLIRSARSHGDLPALVSGTRVLADFRGLARRVAILAHALRHRFGLEKGERVALVMTNHPAFVEVLFAAWHAGLVAVPVNARLHPKEIAYILGHSGARLCFATSDLADVVGALPGLDRLAAIVTVETPDYTRLFEGDAMTATLRAPADPAWIFYTSGTTGRPKGAELSHRNLLAMALGYFVDFDPVAPGDCLFHLGPMCHGSGLYIVPQIAAAAAQVVPESGGFDADEVFALIAAHRRVSFFAAPTIVRRLTEHPAAGAADTSNLKLIAYGGAPMYVEDMKRALDRFGPKFAQLYGQGESPMAITVLSRAFHADRSSPDFERRLGTVGVPQCMVEVIIADADDNPVPPGTPGEVLVRGDTVMNGYLDNLEANTSSLRGGWLHTGDVGSFDADGYLTLMDRSKDVIISGGSNVYPREVEEVLLRHPAVAEVSVIGQPDREWGEIVLAFVACRAGASVTAAELDALCLDHVARYKRPKAYRFLDALPKSAVGKILKTELRAMIAAPQGGPTGSDHQDRRAP